MNVVSSLQDIRSTIVSWRSQGKRVGFVPTMGNLHAGHLALCQQALELVDEVVVSIYVNPLQFGVGEDFDKYPRTLDADKQALQELGVSLLFTPEDSLLYPQGKEQSTRVEVPGLSDVLCGEQRPGHFVGVTTVVAKLLNIVQPDVAVFGEKDFQQLTVIRRMVDDLFMPVEIVGGSTVREASGLAMSSRNNYLSAEQREQAAQLYATLQRIEQQLLEGETDFDSLQAQGLDYLASVGFVPEYISIRDTGDLTLPLQDSTSLVILAAARLGNTRLIDNLRVNLPKSR